MEQVLSLVIYFLFFDMLVIKFYRILEEYNCRQVAIKSASIQNGHDKIQYFLWTQERSIYLSTSIYVFMAAWVLGLFPPLRIFRYLGFWRKCTKPIVWHTTVAGYGGLWSPIRLLL